MDNVSNQKFICSFSELDKQDVERAGGKGASLGEMTQASIPVPPGYVVLTTAFEQFIDETDLRQVIRAELAKVDQAAVHTAELASEQIQNLIKQEEIPDDIAVVVREAFNALDAKFVAVRSSATSEDGTENAWAGQLDSFLNTTKETLLENVKNCWASLFTPRAIFYRIEKGLKESHVSVAVVVQKMVESESSGIAFSVHPVTEDPNQLIIEAGFGLGEAIVSGSITPDSYVVEKEPRKIIDSNVVEQRRGLFRKGDDGDNEWRDIASEQGTKQVLSEEQILELTEHILRIEQHYGFPCDIEWALENGELYIVQSRPITTLQDVEWGQKVPRTEPAVLADRSMYEQSFHAHGVSLLVADVHTHYGEFDYVAFSLANEFHIFVKKDLSLLAQLCSSYYDDPSAIEDSAARIDSAIHNLDTLKMVLDEKHKITVEEFDRFMEEAGKFLMEYSRFDTFVTDRLFDDGARPEIITEIQARKNTVREQGNRVFFNEGSVFSKLLDKIANQYDVTVDVLHHNRVDDVRALLTANTALPQTVETDYLIIKANTDRQYYYGKDVLDIANHLLHTEVRDDGSLSGVSVAKRGVVQGVVKKVATDYKNFSTDHIGDKNTILVTEMTVPEMTSVMNQSAAIVTDLGGMLSHAAITARELNLPCVIGTQVATQVLQDGDVVEVDADNGVVKLIEEGGKQVLNVSEGTTSRSDAHQNGGYSVRDYYFLYQTTGFPRLYVDLCVRYYGNFDTLATCRDGVFRIYVSRDDKADKTTEEIAKLYGSTEAFTETCEQLYQRLSEVPEKVATLIDSKPTTTSLANFFAFVGESFSLYALFDHVHTDNLFTDKAPDNATELANIVAEHKNKIRERFDEEFFIADSTMSEFFNWLAKTYDTTPETITAYTTQELLTLVETGRHSAGETENFVLAGKEQVVIDYTGKEAVDFISALEASNVEKDISKLSGTVAYGSGVVRGVVRVMDVDYRTLAHSLAKINDQAGDFILVAESTLPEMLPAMKRSSAIITDVGGILSHAAISAREIEKTCLIGTQYATQVLQDGDMVEVDADNGLVKILKQGEVSKEIA